MDNTIILTEDKDTGLKHDQNGSSWTQFEVDHFAMQTTGYCFICDEELESGWLCLDGGEECCDEHVVFNADRKEAAK